MKDFEVMGIVLSKKDDVNELSFLNDRGREIIKQYLDDNDRFFQEPQVESFIIEEEKKIVVIAGLLSYESFDIDFRIVEAYSRLVRYMRDRYGKFSVVVDNIVRDDGRLQLVMEVSLMSMYLYTKYLTLKKIGVREISFFYLGEERRDIEIKARIYADANIKAREIINESPSNKSPEKIAQYIQDLFKNSKVKVEIWDEKRIEKERMNLVLSVARGSSHPPRVVIIKYMQGEDNSPPIVLVGKGVIFDSGGYNLKTRLIEKMKLDMAGAMAVVHAIKGMEQLGIKENVIGIIPFVENLVSSKSYLPGDIIISRAGLSVEVKNTDAEGRLILADALDLATEFKPKLIVDVATLTGACMIALGQDVAGLFYHSDLNFVKAMEEAAKEKLESVWRMPLFEEYYLERMLGQVSDLVNVAPDAYGGAIQAAIFLKQFVKHYDWIHLDIAGPAYTDKEKLYKSPGATGYGVRLLMRFLERIV